MTFTIIIIKYIYHALISALSAHTVHINLNMIFYTHAEYSPSKTTDIKYYMETHTQFLLSSFPVSSLRPEAPGLTDLSCPRTLLGLAPCLSSYTHNSCCLPFQSQDSDQRHLVSLTSAVPELWWGWPPACPACWWRPGKERCSASSDGWQWRSGSGRRPQHTAPALHHPALAGHAPLPLWSPRDLQAHTHAHLGMNETCTAV